MIIDSEAKKRLETVRAEITAAAEKAGRTPSDIYLLPVSKTQPVEAICTLHSLGLEVFGESRVQEAAVKYAGLGDVRFHLIGRLQTNKVKQAVQIFDLIQSVDRISLVEALASAAKKAGKIQDILIQVSLAGEEQKGGVTPDGLDSLIEAVQAQSALRLKGFMTIPKWEEDPEKSRPVFKQMKEIFERIRGDIPSIDILSMGMSDDFRVAIGEGSTMVRIGTALFGSRPHNTNNFME